MSNTKPGSGPLIRINRDVLGGLLLMAFAGFLMFAGRGLRLGSAASMGPGYFPQVLNGVLMLLGLAITVRGMRTTAATASASIEKRTAAVVLAMPLLFASLIAPAGLLATVFISAFLVSAIVSPRRWIESLLFSIALAAVCGLLFVKLLGLSLPLWPAW